MGRAKKHPKVEASVEPPLLGAMSNLWRGTPAEVAALFSRYGLDSVQLLPSLGGSQQTDVKELTPKACRSLVEPFLELKIHIAALTAHVNLVDPEIRRREKSIRRFCSLIERCPNFETRYLVTETGTVNPSNPWEDAEQNHAPATFSAFMDALRPCAKLAEETGVVILLEGDRRHVVATMQDAKRVREEFGESVGFVLDPVNYLAQTSASGAKKWLRDIFETIGPWSPIAHAKDVRLTGGEHTAVRAGSGGLDYKDFLEQLHHIHPGCPLIMEQVRPEEIRETIDFIDRFFE